MPFTFPSDTHASGDAGHVIDHNNLVDVLKGSLLVNVLNTAYSGGADPSGVADSAAAIQAAVNALPASGGVVYLPAGTYKVASTITVTRSGVYIAGDGLWISNIKFTGTGDCLRFSDASTYTSRTIHGGGIFGVSVNIGSAGSGSCALHAGDILRFQFAITVQGSGSTSSIGIHLDNQNYWCEQAEGTAWIDSCTQAVVFDCSGATSSTGSYDRGDFTFFLSQKTFLGDVVTFQNGAQLLGGRLRLYGNINSSSSAFSHAVLALTGSTPGGHSPSTFSSLSQCELDINVESDLGLANTFQTVNFGSTSNFITSCSGNISFGAGNQFGQSNITSVASQFSFLGPAVGDATLNQATAPGRFTVGSQAFLFSWVYIGEVGSAPSTPSGGGYVYVDSSGNLHYLGPGGQDTTLAKTGSPAMAASVSYTPSNPTGTVSGTPVMMGLASAFTPAGTGKVRVTISGTWYTATGTTQGTISGRYGTGTAPVNGAAVTGTRFGTGSADWTVKAASAGFGVPFSMTQIVSLTAGTAYWFDLAESTSSNLDATTTGGIVVTIDELAA